MNEVYKDASRPIAERVEDLLSRMTTEEKIGQMTQISINTVSEQEADEWAAKGVGSFLHSLGDTTARLKGIAAKTRLGIPLIFGIDAIHGHALLNGATIFPSQLGASCSWNPILIREMGAVTAREAAEDGLNWLFSPVLCIGRDLRWGRIDETFGEDRFLIAELGKAIIEGYQSENLTAACAKHYLGYGESTGGRDSYDSQISLRKVRETFLPPFQAAAEVGCMTMMAGYQSIDGTPVTSNTEVLRGMLKDEIGFDGFVVTDWNNIQNLVEMQYVASDMKEAVSLAVKAGIDMSMTTLSFYDNALQLAREGGLDMAQVDDAVRRILTVKFRLGLFDNWEERRPKGQVACAPHRTVNLALTQESLVLLKNDNNLLPLSASGLKIAVIGPNADDLQAQYGDWTYFSHPDPNPSAVPTEEYYTVLGGMRAVFDDCEIFYDKGCDILDPAIESIAQAKALAEGCDVVVAVVGDCLAQNGEQKDRSDLTLSGAQLALLEALTETGKPVIAVLVNGKPLCISWLKEHCTAIIETFNAGSLGGLAVAQAMRGLYNPSGKLTISFPQQTGQSPVYYNQLPGWHSSSYMDCPADAVYPFGYGLSYTTYRYGSLSADAGSYMPNDTATLTVDVTNTGKMDGYETVQLYVRDCVSSVVTPVKQLCGFQKIFLKAGETKTVPFSVPMRSLAVVTQDGRRVLEKGEFRFMAGANSKDAEAQQCTVSCTETAEV